MPGMGFNQKRWDPYFETPLWCVLDRRFYWLHFTLSKAERLFLNALEVGTRICPTSRNNLYRLVKLPWWVSLFPCIQRWSFTSSRLAQGLWNLSCNESFIWRDQGRFLLCLEDLCFVSLQRHGFQAWKELEMPLARRKPEYHIKTCEESTPFTKDCCPWVLKALVCINMGYSVCYNLSLNVMIEIVRL